MPAKQIFHFAPFTVLFFSYLLLSCMRQDSPIEGSGIFSARLLELPSFKKIIINDPGNVILEAGERAELIITTDDNIQPYVSAYVTDEILTLGLDHHHVIKPTQLTYILPASFIEEIYVNGPASVKSKNPLKKKSLYLHLDGPGYIELTLYTENLYSSMEGDGKMILKGSAGKQFINTSGTSLYQSSALKSQETHVHLYGAGRVEVAVQKILDVNISGNGTVFYEGLPKITERISGTGSLQNWRPAEQSADQKIDNNQKTS